MNEGEREGEREREGGGGVTSKDFFKLASLLGIRAGKIRSPCRHLRPKNIFGDQIMVCGGQFGD